MSGSGRDIVVAIVAGSAQSEEGFREMQHLDRGVLALLANAAISVGPAAADSSDLSWCQTALHAIEASTGATFAGLDKPHSDILMLRHPEAAQIALFCMPHIGFSLAFQSLEPPTAGYFETVGKASAIIVGAMANQLAADAKSCVVQASRHDAEGHETKVHSDGPEVVTCSVVGRPPVTWVTIKPSYSF